MHQGSRLHFGLEKINVRIEQEFIEFPRVVGVGISQGRFLWRSTDAQMYQR